MGGFEDRARDAQTLPLASDELAALHLQNVDNGRFRELDPASQVRPDRRGDRRRS
jgi:hypothetical protein